MAYLPDEAVLNSCEISPKAFVLYAHFCKFRSNETGKAFPKLATLAKLLKSSRSSACELRMQLVEKGWITIEGDEVTLIMGFQSQPKTPDRSEIPNAEQDDRSEILNDRSEIPNAEPINHSEIPNDRSEIPNAEPINRSEIPNGRSEIPNEPFGNSERHIGRTSPINQPIRTIGGEVSFPRADMRASDAPPPISNGHSVVMTPGAFTGTDLDVQIIAAARANRNPHTFHRLTNNTLVEILPNGRELSPLENALRIACGFPPQMLKPQAVEVEKAARDMQKAYGELDLLLLVRAGEYYAFRKRNDFTASWIAVDWNKIKGFLEEKDNGNTGKTAAAKLGATSNARSRFTPLRV